MINNGHILVLNPGSTSTKLAIYRFALDLQELDILEEALLDHSRLHGNISEQLDIRFADVDNFLEASGVTVQIIMARGAPLRPLIGGTYAVNDTMLADIRSGKYSEHASNLAALIGERMGHKYGLPVYITDPITTDEFEEVARISGVPGISRKSRSHALNIKASLRKLCGSRAFDFNDSAWVVCHMGGGVSVAAVKNGRLIDVNDALLGMGPFSPERAGALPTSGILELIFDEGHDRPSLENLLSKESGLKGYLCTADLQEVETRINRGDAEATLIYQAMVYQISKEIAAMASVNNCQIDGILLTGGMAHSQLLCNSITERVGALSDIFIEAGENEMEALAMAGLRILSGTEKVRTYTEG